MCDALGIADAILPLLAVMWQRSEAGEVGRNEFEKKVANIFASLDSKDAKALAYAFDQYRKLRQSGKGECLFNDCLADAVPKGPIERAWVAEELLREGPAAPSSCVASISSRPRSRCESHALTIRLSWVGRTALSGETK